MRFEPSVDRINNPEELHLENQPQIPHVEESMRPLGRGERASRCRKPSAFFT